ncbi:MAG TPA: hypothetical protein VFJ82_11910 [Longimicrobium sp.]|nr:hypothetical protein [Longimicrobium sp.]
MNPRTPLGFYVCSIAAAGFGVLMLAAALLLEPGGDAFRATGLVARAGAALLAALAAVAAEALWCARRWAYPASLALALVYAGVLTALCVAVDGWPGLGIAFWALTCSAFVVAPIVAYVRGRSIALFGVPRAPVPAPRPAPPPAPVRIGPNGRPVPWW